MALAQSRAAMPLARARSLLLPALLIFPARSRLLAALLLILAGGTAVRAGEAAAPDLARGAELYRLCAACHGDGGAGDANRGAPAIAGLPAWYVADQLAKFKAGQRGYLAADDTGLQMRPMAAALRTDADVASVAAYVARLQPVVHGATVAGDATRGQTLYAPCTACHGADGRGNEALKGPQLAGQADWYLLAQLAKFKSGTRGAHKDDAMGAQMRAMSSVLPDEQAMRDVVAYVRTLAPAAERP